MKLEGTTAVVLGGARGIGKAYTRALLEKKCKVIGNILLFILCEAYTGTGALFVKKVQVMGIITANYINIRPS